MEEQILSIVHGIALAIEVVAILVIAFGTIEAVIGMARLVFTRASDGEKRVIWLRYAQWLVAGLTFQLAADIVGTMVAPTWDQIGRVAAIAAVRTFLTWSLDRDMDTVRSRAGQKS